MQAGQPRLRRGAAFSRRALLRYGAFGLVTALLPGERGVHAGAGPNAGIVACAIHPAIGVARVGNSPTGYFLGPELPGVHAQPADGFKDSAGRLKRQAALFRVYGLDANGNVVKELTAADATITWTIHVANKKAAWYNFDLAFDIPEAMGQPPSPGVPAAVPLTSSRRNSVLQAADRAQLVIDPAALSISGAGVNSSGGDSSYAFNGGRFLGQPVPLGELRTDEQGRLLVLGGFGNSGPGTAIQNTSTFANNDQWHDDTSDGPVEATVQLGGRTLQATGAWVAVAPPNFAPGIQGVVTLYDVLFEVATKLEPARAPVRPSFTRQIYPLLQRHVQNQWVNAGMARQFGWGAPGNLLTPQMLAQLGDASGQSQSVRMQLFQRFRDPAFPSMQPGALPPYYGDNTNIPAQTVRQWLAVLPIQYGWLQQWAAGNFDADWPAGGLQYPASIADLPLDEQPDALDRAALDDCLGGAFHPGCELPWVMRQLVLYAAPFRLLRRSGTEADWGDVMTSAIALSGTGPLHGSGPGDLTRWMAIPWQTDTASCLSAYEPEIDEYLPTFWPAHVPNDVLTAQAYATILAADSSPAQRQAAFSAREKWLRWQPPAGSDPDLAAVNNFLSNWSQYGVITQQAGPAGDATLPDAIWVEMGRSPALDQPAGPG